MQANTENSTPLRPFRRSQNTVNRGKYDYIPIVYYFVISSSKSSACETAASWNSKKRISGDQFWLGSHRKTEADSKHDENMMPLSYDRKGGWQGRQQSLQAIGKAFQKTLEAGKSKMKEIKWKGESLRI